jgi:hypothetical protein
MSTLTSATARSPRYTLLRRWPSALGLAAAVFQLATGADRETAAIVVSVATLCYLGAAALDRRWIAWAGIVGASLLVTVGELVGLVWWGTVVLNAAALVGIGLLGGVPRRPLTAQAVAVLAFGGLAVAALFLTPQVGLVLAGVVLASHAGWDVVHHRRDMVVHRSLAEFCIFLDVPLGLGVILIGLTG